MSARSRLLPVVLTAVLALLVLAAVAVLAVGGGETTGTASSAATSGGSATRGEPKGMAPLPKARPKLVQPEAGRSSVSAADDLAAGAGTAPDDDDSLPKPTGPASVASESRVGTPGASNLSATRATALENGVALPPLEAPEAVLNVIRAGNIIARSPYKWGGGHGRFQDNGYDCSGSVSYALYYAGLVDGPHTSGDYMAYGKPGKGKWITIYANPGHMWMEVAGIRFDTSGARNTGSRWQNDLRNLSGYEVRHPAGL